MRSIMAGINGLYFIVCNSSSGLDSKGPALWRGLVRAAPENAGCAAVSGGDEVAHGHAAEVEGAVGDFTLGRISRRLNHPTRNSPPKKNKGPAMMAKVGQRNRPQKWMT